MPSIIRAAFSTTAPLTITLGSLANSTAGVGRQSTIVDNTASGKFFQDLLIYAKITLGTTPTAFSSVYLYLIRDDGGGTPLRTDGAGASDAAWTARNAELIGTLITGATPQTGDVLVDSFLVRHPGPKWAIGVVNNSGVALNSTNGNHIISYVGSNPESQ